MKYYAEGNGHIDLSNALGIATAESLAVNGSCNSRIIRTTLRDCFTTKEPTLYIIGTTFLTRYELPALLGQSEVDGKWVSFSGVGTGTSMTTKKFDSYFTQQNLSNFSELYEKFTTLGLPDIAEDFMFSVLSLIYTLHHRGHKILLFNTAEHTVEYFIDEDNFDLFRQHNEIVGGFKWRSIPWQFEQGATYPPKDEQYPADCRHVTPGDHRWLNDFLTKYIQEHKILQ